MKYWILLVAVALVAVGFAGCASLSNDALMGTPSPTPAPIIKYVTVIVTVTPTPAATIPPTAHPIALSTTTVPDTSPAGLTGADYEYLDKFQTTGDYFSRAIFYFENEDTPKFTSEMIKVRTRIKSDQDELKKIQTSQNFALVRGCYDRALRYESMAALSLYNYDISGFESNMDKAQTEVYTGDDLLNKIK
jgi:hypothetical protein